MSQALNKVEVMKITEIGCPLIKLHNLGFGVGGGNNGRFFTKETSIVSTNIATNSVETE